jgi:radical SAM protein with 4Fe4S-binding SPASM domain
MFPSLFFGGGTILAQVEFTTRCNLDCIHCSASIYRPALDWKTDQLMNVFKQLLDEGYNEFDLKGGEPFMRSDIFQVMDLLEQHGATFFLSSNALLLTEEKIQKLLSYRGLSTFTVSLDGARKETHEAIRGEKTFDRTLEMVRLVAKWMSRLNSRTRFGLNYTLMKTNHKEIGEIFDLADRLGFDSVFVLTLSMLGNAVEHEDDLALQEREELLALQRGAKVLRKINIARQIKGSRPLEFSVEKFPYTWKCRLMKWSRTFKSSVTRSVCGGGTNRIYIGADGTIFPCEGVRISLDKIQEEVGPFEKPSIWEYTVQEAKQTESFRRIVDLLHDYDRMFKSIEPCNTCGYLGKCTICPLSARRDGGVKRCMEEVLM